MICSESGNGLFISFTLNSKLELYFTEKYEKSNFLVSLGWTILISSLTLFNHSFNANVKRAIRKICSGGIWKMRKYEDCKWRCLLFNTDNGSNGREEDLRGKRLQPISTANSIKRIGEKRHPKKQSWFFCCFEATGLFLILLLKCII